MERSESDIDEKELEWCRRSKQNKNGCDWTFTIALISMQLDFFKQITKGRNLIESTISIVSQFQTKSQW